MKQEIRVARCPICGRPREMRYRPFCSKHCADLDLGRWFAGAYALPVEADEDEDGIEHDLAAANAKRQDLA